MTALFVLNLVVMVVVEGLSHLRDVLTYTSIMHVTVLVVYIVQRVRGEPINIVRLHFEGVLAVHSIIVRMVISNVRVLVNERFSIRRLVRVVVMVPQKDVFFFFHLSNKLTWMVVVSGPPLVNVVVTVVV